MRLSQFPHIQGWWLSRAVRGARLDRNALRRGTDRAETCLFAGLFVLMAAGAPFAAQAASHASYAAALHTQQEQRAARHQVPAVLTTDAATIGGYALNTHVLTAATWTSAAGVRQSGEVPALPGSKHGTTVTVWTDDASGDLVSPPLSAAEAAAQADASMVGVIAGTGVLYVAGAAATRRLLNRRRMAAWEADWRATAPTWNRQRW